MGMTELFHEVELKGRTIRVAAPDPEGGWVYAGQIRAMGRGCKDATLLAKTFVKTAESLGLEVGFVYEEGWQRFFMRRQP